MKLHAVNVSDRGSSGHALRAAVESRRSLIIIWFIGTSVHVPVLNKLAMAVGSQAATALHP